LQRLELDALRVGDVRDPNLAEVGKAGLRTHRREFRAVDRDSIGPLRPRVRKRLDRRARHTRKILAPASTLRGRARGAARSKSGDAEPARDLAARQRSAQPRRYPRFRREIRGVPYVPCLTLARRERYDTRGFR